MPDDSLPPALEDGEWLAEVKTLRGLVPICAWCKRIRDEEQAWQTIESYVQSHSHAEFTHGICDECYQEHLAEPKGPVPCARLNQTTPAA